MALPVATYRAMADKIKSSRILSAIFVPLANWNANASGYRQLGLVYDDIIKEETPIVQEALRRLPAGVLEDRIYRHRRAFQLSLTHQILPKDQWTKPQDDQPYLTPIIEMVEKEYAEKAEYDNLVLKR